MRADDAVGDGDAAVGRRRRLRLWHKDDLRCKREMKHDESDARDMQMVGRRVLSFCNRRLGCGREERPGAAARRAARRSEGRKGTAAARTLALRQKQHQPMQQMQQQSSMQQTMPTSRKMRQ